MRWSTNPRLTSILRTAIIFLCVLPRRGTRPGRAAARVDAPHLAAVALDEHFNPYATGSIMKCVVLYLGEGFFKLLIASQAPPNRTPRKVRKPTVANVHTRNSSLWRHFRAQEPFLPPKVIRNRGPAVIYRSVQTGIWLHRAVCGPLLLPWLWILRFLPGLRCHPTWTHHGSTQTVPEKVHAFPLTRTLLSFPWLRRNPSVFLG